MKRILVLGAPAFQIEVINKAKEMGHYVGVVDINENAPGFPHADETFILLDTQLRLESRGSNKRSNVIMRYDYLIIGAGLYGAVIAQQAKAAGKNVLVVDKRDHIAGNVYTYNC